MWQYWVGSKFNTSEGFMADSEDFHNGTWNSEPSLETVLLLLWRLVCILILVSNLLAFSRSQNSGGYPGPGFCKRGNTWHTSLILEILNLVCINKGKLEIFWLYFTFAFTRNDLIWWEKGHLGAWDGEVTHEMPGWVWRPICACPWPLGGS